LQFREDLGISGNLLSFRGIFEIFPKNNRTPYFQSKVMIWHPGDVDSVEIFEREGVIWTSGGIQSNIDTGISI